MKGTLGLLALGGALGACIGFVIEGRVKDADRRWERSKDCAAQAERRFRADGYKAEYDPKTESSASFTNHVDQGRDRCFMEITSIVGLTNSRSVIDAYEGKEYAGYMFVGVAGKKYEDTKPFDCYVLAAAGEKTYCKNGEEFDEMVKPFMEAEKAAKGK
jgi:hypothetical protein